MRLMHLVHQFMLVVTFQHYNNDGGVMSPIALQPVNTQADSMKSEITSNKIIVCNYNLLSEKNGVDDILASPKEAAKCKRFLRFQDPTDSKENTRNGS